MVDSCSSPEQLPCFRSPPGLARSSWCRLAGSGEQSQHIWGTSSKRINRVWLQQRNDTVLKTGHLAFIKLSKVISLMLTLFVRREILKLQVLKRKSVCSINSSIKPNQTNKDINVNKLLQPHLHIIQNNQGSIYTGYSGVSWKREEEHRSLIYFVFQHDSQTAEAILMIF